LEDKNTVKWTRLSCHDFVDNQGRLQLFVLAYITDSKARDGLAAMDKLMR
jgi:hypothetical protein